ncbi:MAG: hypothetical protein NTW66_01885 [Candidatus Magasanikbacteria bacterium]|nr:hypothetical protein [Candidatus Magasanikbacteria bacterium]
MWWKIVLGILAVIIVAALGYAYYVGFFAKIAVEEKEMGPYVLVYEEHRGAYKDIGIVMDKVYKSLLADGVETTRGMGIYYNNPQNTPEADLRSIGGSLIEEKDMDKLPVLEKKYKVMRIEKQKSIVVEFPYINQWSIMAGVMRVYSVMSKYIADHNYQTKEMVEIYDMPNGKIQYIMGL